MTPILSRFGVSGNPGAVQDAKDVPYVTINYGNLLAVFVRSRFSFSFANFSILLPVEVVVYSESLLRPLES
jgi:hypothetical protein